LEVPGLGPVTVPGYTFFIMIGAIVCVLLVRRDARRSGILIEHGVDFGFVALPMFLIGGRVGYVLSADLPATLKDPLRVFEYWHGGLVFFGGAVGIGLSAWVYSRLRGIRFRQLVDVWARGIALGMIFARTGCLMAGCCWGKPIDRPFGIEWPWGLRFYSGAMPDDFKGIPLHPTQIYSMIAWFSLFLLLTWFRRRQRFDGQRFALLLVLYPPLRFLIEIFRGDELRGVTEVGWSSSQIAAVPIFVLGLWLLWQWRRLAVSEGLYGYTLEGAVAERRARGRERLQAQGLKIRSRESP
jgi:phosphatidylglycerol:prolipoprotein diacylglycerol transferase